jgi:hypothetical protein
MFFIKEIQAIIKNLNPKRAPSYDPLGYAEATRNRK